MRNIPHVRLLGDLLRSPRYELMPTKSIEGSVVDAVPTDVTVTVTASPAKGLAPTLELTERLIGHGYHVVPHVSARLVRDEVQLKDIVEQLLGLGVDDVFVPAGDADPPAGKYVDALQLLIELTAMGRPFRSVGITGYPESHPAIEDDVTVQSMWDKRHHATYIISNLCFDHAILATWIDRVRRRGVQMPIYVGVAGPVERTKLLAMATKIGVGQSTKFLTSHASWFLRFAAPGGYSPERLLDRCARTLVRPDARVGGLHIFTFNQVVETERWRRELLDRAGAR